MNKWNCGHQPPQPSLLPLWFSSPFSSSLTPLVIGRWGPLESGSKLSDSNKTVYQQIKENMDRWSDIQSKSIFLNVERVSAVPLGGAALVQSLKLNDKWAWPRLPELLVCYQFCWGEIVGLLASVITHYLCHRDEMKPVEDGVRNGGQSSPIYTLNYSVVVPRKKWGQSGVTKSNSGKALWLWHSRTTEIHNTSIWVLEALGEDLNGGRTASVKCLDGGVLLLQFHSYWSPQAAGEQIQPIRLTESFDWWTDSNHRVIESSHDLMNSFPDFILATATWILK